MERNFEHFKQCPYCQKWFSVDDFLRSTEIQPIGMKLDHDTFALNLYFFNHYSRDCQTTFAMRVEDFHSFIEEQIPKQILTLSNQCSHYCTKLDELLECNKECVFAPYRRFLHKLIDNRIKEIMPAEMLQYSE